MTNLPIFDGHNDTLLDLYEEAKNGEPEAASGRTFWTRNATGHIDFPRAQEGGLGGGFFAIFIPNKREPGKKNKKPDYSKLPPPLQHKYALREATAMAAILFRLERESEGKLQVVRTARQLATCLKNGVMAAILHFEGAEAIDTNFDSLHVLYQAGLRSLGPVWSRPTKYGNGVPFAFPNSPDIGKGLTKAGKALVRECNQLGVMIDLSHLNEKGFWDVAKITAAPLVATHSNAHALCPSPRNLLDKQLDAIKESGGMVGVNFHVAFLDKKGFANSAKTSYLEIVRHMDYLVERMGIDHVGFGSDFDGARIPADLGDATGLPKILTALRERGYDDAALQKLTHQNWLRVLRATWK
jgi:membrane dipeptidase